MFYDVLVPYSGCDVTSVRWDVVKPGNRFGVGAEDFVFLIEANVHIK